MASGTAARAARPHTLAAALRALPPAVVIRCKVCGLPEALREEVNASLRQGVTRVRLARALALLEHPVSAIAIGRHHLDHLADAKTPQAR